MANIRLNIRIQEYIYVCVCVCVCVCTVYMVLIPQNLTVYVMWVYIILEEQPWE